MVAAEAVAQTLNESDLLTDRVVPHPDRIRDVGLNVATAVALHLEEIGLAELKLGHDAATVRAALSKKMWVPDAATGSPHSRM